MKLLHKKKEKWIKCYFYRISHISTIYIDDWIIFQTIIIFVENDMKKKKKNKLQFIASY